LSTDSAGGMISCFHIKGAKYGFPTGEMKHGISVVANRARNERHEEFGPPAVVAFEYPCGFSGTYTLRKLATIPWEHGMKMTCVSGALTAYHFPWALRFTITATPRPNLAKTCFDSHLGAPKSITFGDETLLAIRMVQDFAYPEVRGIKLSEKIIGITSRSETAVKKIAGASNR
jgi:hypothetical protein